jgi:hypothetical protein
MGEESKSVTFHPEILTVAQRKSLKRLREFTALQDFYLAGGTALAIHLGHRRSQDFDWFTRERIDDAMRLASRIRGEGIPFTTEQIEKGTLYGAVMGVRTGFLEYQYPLLEKPVFWPEGECSLASIPDLACMKLSALAQRGAKKDFVDIYALGSKAVPLKYMLRSYQKKFSVKDVGHILRALTYFDEADRERMPTMFWDDDWKTIRKTIQGWVKTLVGV